MRETRDLSIEVRPEPVAGGDPAVCGGLLGRWRVRLLRGVLAAPNSELLHAMPEGARL